MKRIFVLNGIGDSNMPVNIQKKSEPGGIRTLNPSVSVSFDVKAECSTIELRVHKTTVQEKTAKFIV